MKRRQKLLRWPRLILAGLIGVIAVASAFAQAREITGVVTDAQTGEALIGVNVSVTGTTTGTITDVNGAYSLNVSPGQSILFSYTGIVVVS